jgi:hypothetical protein
MVIGAVGHHGQRVLHHAVLERNRGHENVKTRLQAMAGKIVLALKNRTKRSFIRSAA